MDEEVKCSRCGSLISELAVFPGRICVDCHAEKYDREVAETGEMPIPDFSNTVKNNRG